MNTKPKKPLADKLEKLVVIAGNGLGFAITNTSGFTIPDLTLSTATSSATTNYACCLLILTLTSHASIDQE